MGVVISPESELGKELAKWEQPNYNPALHPYPRMLYRAQEVQGRPSLVDPHDEAFAQKCQLIVPDESAHRRAAQDGWCDGPREALAAYEAKQKAWADEAANAAYHAQRMSKKAQLEYAAADAATHEHVVDVQPRKRRGRPPTVTPVSMTAED